MSSQKPAACLAYFIASISPYITVSLLVKIISRQMRPAITRINGIINWPTSLWGIKTISPFRCSVPSRVLAVRAAAHLSGQNRRALCCGAPPRHWHAHARYTRALTYVTTSMASAVRSAKSRVALLQSSAACATTHRASPPARSNPASVSARAMENPPRPCAVAIGSPPPL